MAFSKMCSKSVPVGDKYKAVIKRILKSMAEQNALRRDHARLPPIHLQQSTQATSAGARVLPTQLRSTIHDHIYGANVPNLDAVVDLTVVEESGPGGGSGEHEARARVHEDGEPPLLVTLIISTRRIRHISHRQLGSARTGIQWHRTAMGGTMPMVIEN